ncbi:MAG: xanthine dehydrogenase family protein subunit M [Alphaproteobacteria bacterium]|nr:xanthine dehydrogenase family protein subunit M [Alphaproteobacteria bacterium]MDP6564539.1 xanthine dehydrogenase family protein subunit M [Alphaproteobacteria bacterium]MDP6815759.1 xanthine dehydrogenase family protein subunit M [Alphaproteobacteria bacterium]
MKPPPFAYLAAGSLDEAISALAAGDGEARLLAGGQSLMPMLNFRLLQPGLLISLNRIPGLGGITENGGGLRIGALTRHAELERSPLVARHFPVLGAAMEHVAHLAIRNRGTIGGSLCHADPAAELPMLMCLLDAGITAQGPAGERTLAAAEFFLGALTTALAEDEIVTAIELPALAEGCGWGFEEMARRSGDFALAGAAAIISLTGDRVSEARLAVMGAHPTPLRVAAAEALLRDQTIDEDTVRAAAEAAAAAVEPDNDLHASADYRRHLIGVLTARVLRAALRRAQGETP